jgi:hypothetical protein
LEDKLASQKGEELREQITYNIVVVSPQGEEYAEGVVAVGD